jgi:hypothetical protein
MTTVSDPPGAGDSALASADARKSDAEISACGFGIRPAMNGMGHKSLSTTMRYLHLASEFKRKDNEVLERPAPFLDAAPTMVSKPPAP